MALKGFYARLTPECRLLCLALASTSIFLSKGSAAAASAIIATAVLLRAGERPGKLARDSAFIAWLFAFAALLQGVRFRGGARIDPAGLAEAAAYCGRLLAAFLAGKAFYVSTRASELRDAATRIARIIPAGARADVGLGLALMLGFIPVISAEWSASVECARARGLSRRPRPGTWAAILAAFLRRLMLRAAGTPQALASRAWRGDRKVAPSPWAAREAAAVSVCALMLAVSAAGLA